MLDTAFPVQTLTAREREILHLVAQGLSDRETARSLSISLDTVKWYNKRIYAKLDAQNRTQAVTRARALGLLDPGGQVAGASDPSPTAAIVPEPAAPRNNLPADVSSFVGRRGEVAAVRRALDDARLLTLTGIGGCGKTRLALAVARELLPTFADGVFFVQLSAVSAPEAVVLAIAEQVGIQFTVEHEPLAQLMTYFRARTQMLVLDNFDHLLAGAGLLTAILQAAPGVKMLVTSREWLNVNGEVIFPVEGLLLSTPERAAGGEQPAGANSEAEHLFLKRAAAVSPAQVWDCASQQDIARICRLVEGMPLSIELAATWVDTLSPGEIAAEIEQTLDILDARRRDAPDRQRSTRAAFEGSWNLLDAVQRAAFRRLAIFAGGFSRDAAEAVCGVQWRTLHTLVAKSLVRRNPRTGRFEFHELLRQFALTHLSAVGEVESYRRAHAAWYAELMAEQWRQMKQQRQHAALHTIEADIENVRAAWHYWIAAADGVQLNKFAHALWAVHDIRGWYLAAIALLTQGTQALQGAGDPAARAALGWMLALQGLFCGAGEAPEQSETPAPSWMTGFGIYVVTGHGQLGYALAHEGVAQLKQTEGYEELLLLALHCLMITSCIRDEEDAALQAAQECLTIAARTGDWWAIANAQQMLAVKAISDGDLAQAERLASAALEAFDAHGDDWSSSIVCIDVLSLAAIRANRHDHARRWLRKGLAAAESLGFVCAMQKAHWQLGFVAALEENYVEAARDWHRAMQVNEQMLGGATFLGFGGSRRWNAEQERS